MSDIINAAYAHEVTLPAEVVIWDEIDSYTAEWRKVGIAQTVKGMYALIAKAEKRAARTWGQTVHERPFLTTGGPRMGTVGVREIGGADVA